MVKYQLKHSKAFKQDPKQLRKSQTLPEHSLVMHPSIHASVRNRKSNKIDLSSQIINPQRPID